MAVSTPKDMYGSNTIYTRITRSRKESERQEYQKETVKREALQKAFRKKSVQAQRNTLKRLRKKNR